ncbi:MAG: hypothetical protein CML66_28020 [Rhodobacteraceae bacterium]|nr:hypothetical protein [Paracoccaceae bacterium]MAY47676.1 hypothetical protein [Paracoccaceae bacterium]
MQTDTPTLVFPSGKSRGWGPVDHMMHLMAQLFEAPLERPVLPQRSRLKIAQRHLFKARQGRAPGVIYLAKAPQDISHLLSLPEFDRPHRFRVLWIVDSFWTDRAPPSRLFSQFDLVIHMQKGEAEFYERMAPGRALYLGWGADVLNLGSAFAERDIDVLRVGRQPEAWDNDDHSFDLCQNAHLRFNGRPPFTPEDPGDPSADQRALMGYYARSKFLVAHSNLAAPAPYTHPTKEYITGRWTDALAAGAIVAGIAPHGDAGAEDLLWPGATLDFDRIDLQDNIARLAEAVSEWTPDRAMQNYRQALIKLDWRWRFAELAARLGLDAPKLTQDLKRLRHVIETVSS